MTRSVERVPPLLVLALGVLVAVAASVALVQRGAPPVPFAAASATSAAPAGVATTVRFVPGEPQLPALPPPAPDAGTDGADADLADRDPVEDGAVDAEPAAELSDAPESGPEPEPVDETRTPRPGDVEGRMVASVLPMLDQEQLAATAERVGVPTRALAAYASAALRLREEQPRCNLTWVTLAGIGYVESHHGTIGGRQVHADGTVSEPIIGIPLDGGPNVRAIRDTDGGRYDGDPVWDRAVGPMQFIPSTWARWGADGTGNGEADPQHLDDAALAAARYLCASDRDLTESTNWGQALWSYNRSEDYIRHVLHVANTYAERANAG